MRYTCRPELSDVDLVCYRLHDEGEGAVAIGQTVFLLRPGTPAVYAAQTHLAEVNAEVGYLRRGNLG